MSKAFTRESDSDSDFPIPSRPMSPLPAGEKNYMTRSGAERLRAELDALQKEASGRTENPESRRKLHERIRYLDQSLQSAVILDPPAPPWNDVRFGATVTVRYPDGEQVAYRIVGVDEADTSRDWISWCSPLAKALNERKLGERVRFQAPAGEQELEIMAITYE